MTGKKRIGIIDALRGLAVLLMVAHHLLYDLVEFADAPAWLFSNPVFDFLHYVFAGLFIFLSGLSSQLTRSNIKRGIIALLLALGISLVTFIMETPILFGVLHLLGFSMLFYGLTRGAWDKIPRKIAPFLYVVLIVSGALAVTYIRLDVDFLWIFGWYTQGFVSYDYFPLLPWLFVFLLGTWAGRYVVEGRLPDVFYDTHVPFFPAVGKRALIIYILHQPVLYGFTMLIVYIKNSLTGG